MSGRPNPPLLSAAEAGRLLDDVIFTRLAELVDLPRLRDLELMLTQQLEQLTASRDAARGLAKEIIDRALLRFARATRMWTEQDPVPSASGTDACEDCGDAGPHAGAPGGAGKRSRPPS
jgi:hypothetical protein